MAVVTPELFLKCIGCLETSCNYPIAPSKLKFIVALPEQKQRKNNRRNDEAKENTE